MGREVIKIYRELFRYARLLPRAQREEKILEARKAFKGNKDETDPQKIAQYLREANSRLSFLKIITPRKRGASDSGRFMYENGKWVAEEKTEKEEKSNVKQNHHMGDLLKRHNSLLERQRRAGLGFDIGVT